MTYENVLPGFETQYEDGHLAQVPTSLANAEIKIGAASSGTPGRVYTLSGPDAKKNAKTIFGGGPLLKAIEEAFNAGSSLIYAMRLGTPTRGALVLPNTAGANALRLKSTYNLAGNAHYANVQQVINSVVSAYAGLFIGATKRVKFYSSAYAAGENIPLASEIAAAKGVAAESIFAQLGGSRGFYVLGTTSGGATKIWHYSSAGVIVPADTADLTTLLALAEGESAQGLETGFFPGQFGLTTNQRFMLVDISDPANPEATGEIDYAADLAIESPDISAVAAWTNLTSMILGSSDGSAYWVVADKTAKKLYRIAVSGEGVAALSGTIDISSLIGGTSVVEGVTFVDNTITKVAVMERISSSASLLRPLTINWDAQTATAGTSHELDQDGYDLAGYISDANIASGLTIQDRNESPVVTRRYEATGTMSTVTGLLIAQVVAGGVYAVDTIDATLPLMPSLAGGDGEPDPTYYSQFSGGSNADSPSNGDYIAGLAATVGRKDASWIHAVGATSAAQWAAILAHCQDMQTDYESERQAILECPAFSSVHEADTAEYLADVEDYVAAMETQLALIGDKNGIAVPGGRHFTGSDGLDYVNSLAASVGGVWASLQVHKSLVNKIIPGDGALVPEFSPGHLKRLILARSNPCRFEPGRGVVICQSLSTAPEGSDFKNAHNLRAVYYGVKAARKAGNADVGEDNDAEGFGLRSLKDKLDAPLDDMKKHKQIDDFETTLSSDDADRLAERVWADVKIKPIRAKNFINMRVYLG